MDAVLIHFNVCEDVANIIYYHLHSLYLNQVHKELIRGKWLIVVSGIGRKRWWSGRF